MRAFVNALRRTVCRLCERKARASLVTKGVGIKEDSFQVKRRIPEEFLPLAKSRDCFTHRGADLYLNFTARLTELERAPAENLLECLLEVRRSRRHDVQANLGGSILTGHQDLTVLSDPLSFVHRVEEVAAHWDIARC